MTFMNDDKFLNGFYEGTDYNEFSLRDGIPHSRVRFAHIYLVPIQL
jgi:hypothetical protein